MDDMNTIGFGIIGTGAIAATHADALRQVQGTKLRAIFSRSEDRARKFSERYCVDRSSSLAELLARHDIDVICVTTPSGAHAEVAIPAFLAGKHVLCEKPLEVNLHKADRMIEAAAQNGRILAAVFQSRLSPPVQTLKTAVHEGRFGRLALCSAYVKWWRSNEYYESAGWRGTWALDGGGALMNQGIHYADLLQWLAGMPEEVFAHTATRAHEGLEVEDVVCGSLRFSSGALGVLEISTACFPGYKRRIEICGDRGSAILEDNRLTQWEFSESRPGDAEVLNQDDGLNLGGGTSDPLDISSDGHRLQIEDLAKAVREKGAPKIPGSEGRNAIQLVESIYRSVRIGRPVVL